MATDHEISKSKMATNHENSKSKMASDHMMTTSHQVGILTRSSKTISQYLLIMTSCCQSRTLVQHFLSILLNNDVLLQISHVNKILILNFALSRWN